jgi:hypothetical protein
VSTKRLITLVASVGLVLVLVLIGCSQTTTGGGGGAPAGNVQEPTYNCLNPQGEFIPVQTVGLAPRLDTFDGKTMWVSQTEADPVLMPALYARLVKDYPKTDWHTNSTGSTSPVRLTADEQKACQAMIMGDAW